MCLETASVLLDHLLSHVWKLQKRVSLLPHTLGKVLLEVDQSAECLVAQFLAGGSALCHAVDLLTSLDHH